MSATSFLQTIPSNVLDSIEYSVLETQLRQRYAANPQLNMRTTDIFKAIDWIESKSGKFRSAVIVTGAGERLIFTNMGFSRLEYARPTKPKHHPAVPYTPVKLTTGIEDLSVPLEMLPMRELKEMFTDHHGDYLQCDSHGYIYRNGRLSYRVSKTDLGYYCDVEQRREWFFENRHHSGYTEEVYAHREALWIMVGEPLFYRKKSSALGTAATNDYSIQRSESW